MEAAAGGRERDVRARSLGQCAVAATGGRLQIRACAWRRDKKKEDRLGFLVFGSDAALETTVNSTVDPKKEKIFAVVGSDRTDIAGAVRLGTAAFPETGQKRLVLLSDGNENMGDALNAVLSAKPLGVTIDVIPLGASRAAMTFPCNDSALPSRVKKGQTIEAKIFVQSDRKQKGQLRLYRDEQFLGEQEVELEPGKNLFTFPQTLNEPKFYTYSAQVDVPGDNIPQNNRATAFVNVRGDPRILLVIVGRGSRTRRWPRRCGPRTSSCRSSAWTSSPIRSRSCRATIPFSSATSRRAIWAIA